MTSYSIIRVGVWKKGKLMKSFIVPVRHVSGVCLTEEAITILRTFDVEQRVAGEKPLIENGSTLRAVELMFENGFEEI